jgi:hypothetical protein
MGTGLNFADAEEWKYIKHIQVMFSIIVTSKFCDDPKKTRNGFLLHSRL